MFGILSRGLLMPKIVVDNDGGQRTDAGMLGRSVSVRVLAIGVWGSLGVASVSTLSVSWRERGWACGRTGSLQGRSAGV